MEMQLQLLNLVKFLIIIITDILEYIMKPYA